MHISSLENGEKTAEKTLQNASFTWYNYHKYTNTRRICRDLLSFGMLACVRPRTCGGQRRNKSGEKVVCCNGFVRAAPKHGSILHRDDKDLPTCARRRRAGRRQILYVTQRLPYESVIRQAKFHEKGGKNK